MNEGLIRVHSRETGRKGNPDGRERNGAVARGTFSRRDIYSSSFEDGKCLDVRNDPVEGETNNAEEEREGYTASYRQ